MTLRALIVEPGPNFSVLDVANGWQAGLRALGVDAQKFNFSDRLEFYTSAHFKRDSGEFVKAFEDENDGVRLAAKGITSMCYEWWPDLVIIVSGFYVPELIYQVIRARRQKVVLLCTESPYEDDTQVDRAHYADWVVLNDPTNLPKFRAVNGRSFYIPHAYDPEIHQPGPVDPEVASDFCFVGTGYPSRIEFLEQVDFGGLNVRIGGNWGPVTQDSPIRPHLGHDVNACLHNHETVRWYQSTKVSANIYRREAQRDELATGWAMGPREVELAATGTFYLRQARGENDLILPMLPTFDGPADFGEKVRWWAKHDDERETVALQARAAVADRTFTQNARRLLHLIYG